MISARTFNRKIVNLLFSNKHHNEFYELVLVSRITFRDEKSDSSESFRRETLRIKNFSLTQKPDERISTSAFVAINKRMIFHHKIQEVCRLGFNTRIDILSAKRLHNISHYPIQRSFCTFSSKQISRFTLLYKFSFKYRDTFSKLGSCESHFLFGGILNIKCFFIIRIQRHPCIREQPHEL